MEIKQLYPFVLLILLVSMVIGAGVLALDKFGASVKTSTLLVNESVTTISGTATLANDDVTDINYVVNATNGVVFIDENVSASPLFNFTVNGVVTSGFSDAAMNITYTYDADSVTTTAISAGSLEVSNVSTNWLGLVVTIGILSIIIVLIVKGFGQQQQR